MLDLLDHAIRSGIITNDGSVAVEDYVVHLLEGIYHSYEDKNLFLNQMLQVINDKTRLEHLHFHIDTENNVKIINLLYSAWKQSRFINPSDEANPEYKNTKGPIFLPYESEKWAGFYFSNAKVSFEKQTIKVEFETGKYEEVEVTSPKFAGGKGTVKKEIIEDYKYHPFHPIYIKNVAQQETTIAFESIIPAFLLYVNENKTWWHNFVKTGEYIIDGVTTLSGIGNLAKFRHLARLGEAGSFIATITVAAGAVEVTSGTVSVLLKLTGLEDTETGKNLQEFLFYLELITLAGEVSVALKKGLQKSAKNLVEKPDDLAKLEKQLDDLIKKGELDQAGKQKLLDEVFEVAEVERKLGDFIMHSGDDISEKFIKGIVKQVRESTGLKNFDIHLVDRNNEKYKKLFDQWQKGGGHGFFKPTTGEFGIPLYRGLFGEGPQIYMFAGKTIDQWGVAKNVFFTKYTTQHELFHVEMFMYLKNKTPNYMKYWAEIPNYMHEQYVLNRLLKTKNWKKEDLLSDLENINSERVEKLGMNPITLKELETWKFEIELEKIGIKIK